jgi:hypothetical protein
MMKELLGDAAQQTVMAWARAVGSDDDGLCTEPAGGSHQSVRRIVVDKVGLKTSTRQSQLLGPGSIEILLCFSTQWDPIDLHGGENEFGGGCECMHDMKHSVLCYSLTDPAQRSRRRRRSVQTDNNAIEGTHRFELGKTPCADQEEKVTAGFLVDGCRGHERLLE